MLTEAVVLTQIPEIAKALNMDIEVYTLNDKEETECLYVNTELEGKSEKIRLHFERADLKQSSFKGHFVLIKKFGAYGCGIKCALCGMVFNEK